MKRNMSLTALLEVRQIAPSAEEQLVYINALIALMTARADVIQPYS